MKIERAPTEDLPKAQEFYSSVGYYSEIQPDDIVFSAKDDDKIIGIVRIAPEEGTLVLRGMMIAESHQRKGIGTMMIKRLEQSIGERDCFCIPHAWLEGFYGQIGFKKIEDGLAPIHLQARIKENRKKYPHLIMMKRSV